jgi:cobaltochelatase CobT
MTEQLASLFDENAPEPKAMAIPPLTDRTVRGGGSAVSGATSGAPSYGKKVDLGRAVKKTSLQEVKGPKK